MQPETKPCENCGIPVSKTTRQANQRRSWTCGRSCAHYMRVKAGRVSPTWQPNRFRGQRETRPCSECDGPITRYVTEENHDQPWKCSRRCALKAQFGQPRLKHGKDIPCATCGEMFYRPSSRTGRKYCSAECRHAGQIGPLIEKPCEVCGTVLRLRPSETAKRFCSWACSQAKKYTNVVPGRTHNGKPVRIDAWGYLLIYEPEFAPPSKNGWALEHRVVMAKKHGRPLLDSEEVHHLNSDRQDNRDENLEVLNKADHRRATGKQSREKRMTMADKLAEYERRFGPLPA